MQVSFANTLSSTGTYLLFLSFQVFNKWVPNLGYLYPYEYIYLSERVHFLYSLRKINFET